MDFSLKRTSFHNTNNETNVNKLIELMKLPSEFNYFGVKDRYGDMCIHTEISTLEELEKFREKVGEELIIRDAVWENDTKMIEIYDTYRE